MLETDLFEPVKNYLELQGYTVNAEVKDCDIVATRDDEMIIVELKQNANLQLLIQATDRQTISSGVYVAIPARSNNKHFRSVQRILRRLELGLLIVTFRPMGPVVKRIFDPSPGRRKQLKKRKIAVINEIAGRSAEYNTGGSTRIKLVTAYRENAVLIAACLARVGRCSPRELRHFGTGEKTSAILQKNYYGWFDRVARGVYVLSEQGVEDLKAYPELIEAAKAFLDRAVDPT